MNPLYTILGIFNNVQFAQGFREKDLVDFYIQNIIDFININDVKG